MEFRTLLEFKVAEQFQLQRVGYLLGAGSSWLNGNGGAVRNGERRLTTACNGTVLRAAADARR